MSYLWVISHMMNMCPNHISLFHRILFYVVGDVCFYSAVSRWVTCYVVASPLWHVVIGSLVDYSFVFRNFNFDWKILCTVYVLWWDYSKLTVVVMMMIAIITIKSSLVPLSEGLCAQIYFRFEISVVCSHLVRSFSHFLFLRHRIMCWPGPLPKG